MCERHDVSQILLVMIFVFLEVNTALAGEDQQILQKAVESLHSQRKSFEKIELLYEERAISASSFTEMMQGQLKVTYGPNKHQYKTDRVYEISRSFLPDGSTESLNIQHKKVQLGLNPARKWSDISETTGEFYGNLYFDDNPIRNLLDQCASGAIPYVYEGPVDFQGIITQSFLLNKRWRVQFDPSLGMAIVAIQQLLDPVNSGDNVIEIYFTGWKEIKPGCWYPTRIITASDHPGRTFYRAVETVVTHVSTSPVFTDSELTVDLPKETTLTIDSLQETIQKPMTISIHHAEKLIFNKRWDEVFFSLFRNPKEAWELLKEYPGVRAVMIQWGVGIALLVVVVVSWLVWGRRKRVGASGA